MFFVEITDELPDLKTISATLQVIYGLGGTVIGSINVPVQRNLLPASSDVVKEASISRKVLQEGLGKPVPAFAYPYGSTDPVVQHLVGTCGYIYGLTTVSRLSEFNDPMLALPRVDVSGSEDLGQFIQKLPTW